MSFALNASTRIISPAKTPELLAASLPVGSTAAPGARLRDERPCHYADGALFASALRAAIEPRDRSWLKRVDAALSERVRGRTLDRMNDHLDRIGIAPTAALERKES